MLRLIGAGRRKTVIDADIAALCPAEVLEPLAKCREAGVGLRVVLGIADEHADPPQLARLLRSHHERPHGHRAAEQADELPSLQLSSDTIAGPNATDMSKNAAAK